MPIPNLRLAVPLAFVIALALLALNPVSTHAGGTTFTVNSPDEEHDGDLDGICVTDGPPRCTLTAAIEEANNVDGADTIKFDGSFSSIPLELELPYIDVSDGITFDGDIGNGNTIQIARDENSTVNFGLVFITQAGVPAKNIQVKNVTLRGFGYDGLQVCAGVFNGTCGGDADGVDISNVTAAFNGQVGIRVFGDNLANVKITNSPTQTQTNGIVVQGSESITKLTMTDNSAINNAGDGVEILGGSVDNVAITNDHYIVNGGNGLYFHSNGTMHDITLTGLLADVNSANGLGVFTTSGSLFKLTMSDPVATTNGLAGIAILASGGLSTSTVTNAKSDGNTGDGLTLGGSSGFGTTTVTAGEFKDNGGHGIDAASATGKLNSLHISSALISGNTLDGIHVSAAQTHIDGAASLIEKNTITDNGGGGILLTGFARTVTISQNSTYANDGLGIDLAAAGDPPTGVTQNDTGDADTGPNDLLNFPDLDSITPNNVSGTACNGCTVEVFLSDNDLTEHGEGKTYLATATASNTGEWSVAFCKQGVDYGNGASLTAIARDADGNTSEFADNFGNVGSLADFCATPTPTPTPSHSATPTHSVTPSPTHSATPSPTGTSQQLQGDLTCDNNVTLADATALLAYLATHDSPPTGCLSAAGASSFGDVNCDSASNTLDVLFILRYLVDLPPLPHGAGCADVGDPA